MFHNKNIIQYHARFDDFLRYRFLSLLTIILGKYFFIQARTEEHS